jgi:hypothetical protein
MAAPDGCCIAAAGSVVTRLVQDFEGVACDPGYAMPRRHSQCGGSEARINLGASPT